MISFSLATESQFTHAELCEIVYRAVQKKLQKV